MKCILHCNARFSIKCISHQIMIKCLKMPSRPEKNHWSTQFCWMYYLEIEEGRTGWVRLSQNSVTVAVLSQFAITKCNTLQQWSYFLKQQMGQSNPCVAHTIQSHKTKGAAGIGILLTYQINKNRIYSEGCDRCKLNKVSLFRGDPLIE